MCDYVTRATDLFTLGCVGLIVGTAIFSYLADLKGRKLAFYMSTMAMMLFQLIQIGVSHNYGAYAAMKVMARQRARGDFLVSVHFQILAFACMLPLFQTPLSITTEISSVKSRAFVIGLGCVTWALGNMALPLLGWLIQRWKWITVACTLPMAFVFFSIKIVPESPRWLVTVGRMAEAKAVLVL